MTQHTVRWTLLVALLVSAASCKERSRSATPAGEQGSDQSFEQGMRIACDAPDQADLPPETAGEINRAMVLAAWIDRRVHNREVRQLMGGTAAQTPDGKLEALRAGARRAGIPRCALAEMWQSTPTSQGPAAADEADDGDGAGLDAGRFAASEPQTYDEAIAILCEAPTRAGLPAQPDATAEAAALDRLVRERISNREVADLFTELARAAPRDRVRRLGQAASKSGVAACPLADLWRERQAARAR